MGKCYLVTGAGGRLGGKFVEVLCENNTDDVTKLKLFDVRFTDDVRNRQAELCKAAGIDVEWVVGSITDREIVSSAMKDVHVVLHMASIIDVHDAVKAIWDVNVGGTINILDACCKKNVPYFIYTSSSQAVGPNTDCDPMDMGDEDSPYVFKATNSYSMTKHEAERQVLTANGRKLTNGSILTTCALRPGHMYGGEDDIMANYIAKTTGKIKMIISLSRESAYQDAMRIENAAWSHIVAAKVIQEKRKVVGGFAYCIGDDTPRMSYFRLNFRFFEHLGYKISWEPVLPFWVLYFLAILLMFSTKLLSLIGIHLKAVLNTSIVTMTTTCFTFSHEKFEKHFNYKPIYTWEESLEKMREDVSRIWKNNKGMFV